MCLYSRIIQIIGDLAELRSVNALYAAVERMEELLRYYGRKPVSEEELEAVRTIFRESGALDYARDTMNACFARAERRLSRMAFLDADDRAVFRGLCAYMRGRRK